MEISLHNANVLAWTDQRSRQSQSVWQGVRGVGILLPPLRWGNETGAGRQDADACPERQEGETHGECFRAK